MGGGTFFETRMTFANLQTITCQGFRGKGCPTKATFTQTHPLQRSCPACHEAVTVRGATHRALLAADNRKAAEGARNVEGEIVGLKGAEKVH